MIEVKDVTKSYGPIEALAGVSLDIHQGEIVGLLGPNGAGKTTLMKILTGYLQPDGGTVTIDGLDVLTHTRAIQARIGYLPENAPLYPELSVQAYLKLMADLREIPEAEQPRRLSEAIVATSLQDRLTQPIGTLSKGFRQRVGLAQAILHKPKFLVFDEPTVGLDPTQIVEIRRLIKRLSQESTILFSTHILSTLAATADAILVLQDRQRDVEAALAGLAHVRTVEPLQTADAFPAYRIVGTDASDNDLCPAIYDLARQRNWPLRELRRDVRTLESVFNLLATGG